MRTSTIAAIALLLGCAPRQSEVSVQGQIDGQDLALHRAFFFQTEESRGRRSALGVVSTWARQQESGGCDSKRDNPCEAYGSKWDTGSSGSWNHYFPDDFWAATVWILTDDYDQDLTGSTVHGASWGGPAQDGQMFASFLHYSGDLTYTYGISAMGWVSDGGRFEVTRHKPNREISGVLVTDVVDDEDGRKVGKVEIEITGATRCEAAEGIYAPSPPTYSGTR